MAFRFSRLGAKLVLWDINVEAVQTTADDISTETGNPVYPFALDVTDREKVYDIAQQVKSRVGLVDILINNAGIVSGKSILNPNFSDERAEKTIAVNTTSHIWTIRAFVPDMVRRNRGHVVTIASAAGLTGVCGLLDYCASKFGAVGLNESLRREFRKYGHHGCKTTVVCPYYIRTGMFHGVKTPIIPILEEDYAADSIVNAIRENREFLGMPWITHYVLLPVSAVCPVWLTDVLLDILGGSAGMDTFIGRQEVKME
jgi:all-trans-retinol dehydrogenase (NAD+)